MERRRMDPYSPGGALSPENMVFRSNHPLNKGKPAKHHIGRPNKRYSKHDILGPIMDSMSLMYYRLGWEGPSWCSEDDASLPASFAKLGAHFHAPGHCLSSSESTRPPLCQHCGTTDPSSFSITSFPRNWKASREFDVTRKATPCRDGRPDCRRDRFRNGRRDDRLNIAVAPAN